MLRRVFLLFPLLLALSAPLKAAVDLVTLPTREGTQLTIYNSEDITMVREHRLLTVKEGINRIQFSWANTLIDPTSIEFRILDQQDKVDLVDTTFPAGRNDALQWSITSKMAGKVPVEIRYFTSGITWSADYVGIANEDETKLNVTSYVRVTNGSGEMYDNAQTRLVVGKINLVEKIAELARRPAPGPLSKMPPTGTIFHHDTADSPFLFAKRVEQAEKTKDIIKQGLSEYFLFTIEGREDIKDKEPKRLVALKVTDVPLESIYKLSDRHVIPDRNQIPYASLEGEITVVTGNNIVQVSVGTDDDVQRGHRFDIFHGDEYVGQIEATEITYNRAVCGIVPGTVRFSPQKGDYVVASTIKRSATADPDHITKFYRFKNVKLLDEKGKEKKLSSMENLGLSPLPNGMVRLFSEYKNKDLAYVGGTETKYVPIGDRMEVNVGPDKDITIYRRLKDQKISSIVARQYKRRLDDQFVLYYDLVDYDETLFYEEELVSGKPVPAKIEVERHFDANVVLWGSEGEPKDWASNEPGAYVDLHAVAGRVERVDQQHVKYFLDLKPGKKQRVEYSVTYKRRKVEPELNSERMREPL